MTALQTTLLPPRIRETKAGTAVSLRSRVGLNAANFFLAEVTGVTMPFVSDYLATHEFKPLQLNLALAAAGLGVFLMQSPAGYITDRVKQRRHLLAGASLLLGLCYGLLPLVPALLGWVAPLLFVSGVGQAFFAPLLGALALALVGHRGLNRMMGINQGWNHAGNLAAALIAVVLIAALGVVSVFYAVLAVSILASASVFLIRERELDEERASGGREEGKVGFFQLIRDRRVAVLVVSVALFHLANAPVMPLVAQYVKVLDGTSTQVALVVLVAQAVMIPMALVTGWLVDVWGRKPIFAIGFAVLPLRIGLYALAGSPEMLIALQTLDGIGAGIYGVAVVAMCADLTKGKDCFNTLAGVLATALCIGGVLGPIGTGLLAQYLSYPVAFGVFALIAAVAAVLFIGFMPETRRQGKKEADYHAVS